MTALHGLTPRTYRIHLDTEKSITVEVTKTGAKLDSNLKLKDTDTVFKVDETITRAYNVAIDGLETTIVNLAEAGIAIDSPGHVAGIARAIHAIAEKYLKT